MASCVAVPLYPPTRIQRLEEHVRRQARIMANAQAAVLVTFEEVKKIGGLLKSLLPDLRAIVTPAELASEPGGERLRARGGDLAFLQYFGKHRRAEGVMLTHANLLANIHAMIRGCAATPADTVVSWLPLYHDMGLIGAWLVVLCAGARLVLMSPATFMGRPARWLRAISAWKARCRPPRTSPTTSARPSLTTSTLRVSTFRAGASRSTVPSPSTSRRSSASRLALPLTASGVKRWRPYTGSRRTASA